MKTRIIISPSLRSASLSAVITSIAEARKALDAQHKKFGTSDKKLARYLALRNDLEETSDTEEGTEDWGVKNRMIDLRRKIAALPKARAIEQAMMKVGVRLALDGDMLDPTSSIVFQNLKFDYLS